MVAAAPCAPPRPRPPPAAAGRRAWSPAGRARSGTWAGSTGGASSSAARAARGQANDRRPATPASGSTYQGEAAGRAISPGASAVTTGSCAPWRVQHPVDPARAARGRGRSTGPSFARQWQRPVASTRCSSRSSVSGIVRQRPRIVPALARGHQPADQRVLRPHEAGGGHREIDGGIVALGTPAAGLQPARHARRQRHDRPLADGARVQEVEHLLGRRAGGDRSGADRPRRGAPASRRPARPTGRAAVAAAPAGGAWGSAPGAAPRPGAPPSSAPRRACTGRRPGRCSS